MFNVAPTNRVLCLLSKIGWSSSAYFEESRNVVSHGCVPTSRLDVEGEFVVFQMCSKRWRFSNYTWLQVVRNQFGFSVEASGRPGFASRDTESSVEPSMSSWLSWLWHDYVEDNWPLTADLFSIEPCRRRLVFIS